MNNFPKRLRNTLLALVGVGLVAATLVAQAGDIVTYVHTDPQGNPVAKTDSTGAVIWRQSYTPYGQTYQQADPDGPGFTGHRNDAATGLVYMQARYYDPKIGRFLSVDPVAFSPDSPRHFNLYWYANGNPYRYTDPDGRCSDAGNGCDAMVQAYAANRLANPTAPLTPIDKIGLTVGIAAATATGMDEAAGAAAAIRAVGRSVVSNTVSNALKSASSESAGPLKNASGNLDRAAESARTQPANTPNLTAHVRSQMQSRGISTEQVVDAANHGEVVPSKPGDPVVRRMSTSSGRKIEVRQDVRTNNVVTAIDKGSAN